MEVAQFSPD